MRYLLSEIATITGGRVVGDDMLVTTFVYDSRMLFFAQGAMFVAIRAKRDGHDYLDELANRGISAFLISDENSFRLSMGSAVVVDDTLVALQALATHYRENHIKGCVTAVVGSNGKTIVKEWIWQLSSGELYRSPRSYNSQLGVALSLLAAPTSGDVVIEAGISTEGEMATLERMIRPHRVIFTSLGRAHDSGFDNWQQKAKQKLIMAHRASSIIYPAQDINISSIVDNYLNPAIRRLTFGVELGDVRLCNSASGAVLFVGNEDVAIDRNFTPHTALLNGAAAAAYYVDKVCGDNFNNSVDNFVDNFSFLGSLSAKLSKLENVAMRLELKSTRGSGLVINDSYNSDIDSLTVALDYLVSVSAARERVVVISDIYNSKLADEQLYSKVAQLLERANISRVIGVGERISSFKKLFLPNAKFFLTSEELLTSLSYDELYGVALLIKGSRHFALERLSLQIEERVHATQLEVNLDRMAANLNYYRSHLGGGVRVMAMVKALAYGLAGDNGEVATRLVREGVDYLAVAYADEGVALRRKGIQIPIVVLNSDPSGYSTMIENRLEPEIYSLYSLDAFTREAIRYGEQAYPVHIKLDSGMNRLGFKGGDIDVLIKQLVCNHTLSVVSIFSHLAAAEDVAEDNFTREQVACFNKMANRICSSLPNGDSIALHICNSAAILHHSYAHFDMVRLGIGLYANRDGESVATLTSVVVDVKSIAAGESVSYNRNYIATSERKIAVVAIGYADGLDRRLPSLGWHYQINGHSCPVVGNICMDLSMVDVSDVPHISPGDRVQIFGDGNSADTMAELLGTIEYDIYTSISRRVKRIFLKE